MFHSHYVSGSTCARTAIKFAENAAKHIVAHSSPEHPPLILATGISGITLASHVLNELWRTNQLEPAVVFFRRPDERTISGYSAPHVLACDLNSAPEFHAFLIDDLVDQGRTLARVREALPSALNQMSTFAEYRTPTIEYTQAHLQVLVFSASPSRLRDEYCTRVYTMPR